MSPVTSGLISMFCLMRLPPICMIIPLRAGAIVTDLASATPAFLTLTVSPIPEPQFLLSSPSMRIMSSPISTGYARTAMAAVFLFPSISTISPSDMPMRFISLAETRIMPRPKSPRSVSSPTFSFTSSVMFNTTPLIDILNKQKLIQR